MNLEGLLNSLNTPQPAVRISVARVLGMVEETRALSVLAQHYKTETDPGVKTALAWAGQRLHAAQQAGYATINEIFRQFGVDREIENREDENEAQLVAKMQQNLDADLARMKTEAGAKQAGLTMGLMAAGMVTGLPIGGMMGTTSNMLTPGASLASSNLGVQRPQMGKERVPAAMPSAADIAVWVRRLREGTPAEREKAALELTTLNNPAALPALAATFVCDSNPKVQQAAQRAGKLLYWGALYWEMEHDGSLVKEMERRARLMGKPTGPQPQAAAPQPATPPPQADVNAILRQAQAARAKRGKRQ